MSEGMKSKENASLTWEELAAFCEKIGLRDEKTENAEKLKPPIGVMPYWIEQRTRIKELAQAISRYANYIPDHISRKRNNNLMRGWAIEIQQLLDMIDALDEIND